MKNPFLPLLTLALLITGFTASSQARLNSLPSATATLYLDFDGQNVNSPVWNNGNPITCAASPLTEAQIAEVFNRVAEDYRPFNINITTDSTVFEAAPIAKRIRVIVTPTSSWFAGVGGVAFLGSFTWGDDTPCFVFCDRLGNAAKYVAECCSHESGHTMGLSHQSKYDGNCNLTATYNEGIGSGEAAWAPIMGNSYYRNMSGWNNGPTPYGCNNTQDNLTIISTQNGYGFRDDDYSDDINTNPKAINISSLNINGIINSSTDKDAFKFSLTQNSNVKLTVNPFSIGAGNEGADLDIKVSLYNGMKQLIKTYDPANSLGVQVDTILLSGIYYMVIDGTGNINATDYGSLGSYNITGISGVLPIRSVKLTGNVVANKHKLNWQVVAEEALQSFTVQVSDDGHYFYNISSLDKTTSNFINSPIQSNTIYYRIQVLFADGLTAFSNIISIGGNNKSGHAFTVSTMVSNEISVQAASQYQYVLSDINGNVLSKGNGKSGFSKINSSSFARGIYLLQLIGENAKQTERIIKL